MSGTFWKITAVAFVAGLFYVGSGLRPGTSVPLFATPAMANVAVANDQVETVITASSDGRTLYVWRYLGVKAPKYLGTAVAPRP